MTFGSQLDDSFHRSVSLTLSSSKLDPHQGALDELWQIILLAIPVIFSYIIEFGLPIITMMLVGHLGVEELDGLALGTMGGNMTGAAFVVGTAVVLDTLSTQAYGARNYERVGLLAQRALLICFCLSIPISILWWNVETILLMLGQNAATSRMAGLYLKWLTVYLIPLSVFEVSKKFISSQGITAPVTYIMVLACLFHAPLTYSLVWLSGLGFVGSPIALILTYCFMAGLNLFYIAYGGRWFPGSTEDNPNRCWGGWSWAALHQWVPFLRLGLGAMAQLCLEWWAFEALVLLAGYLGPTALAASSITLQMATLSYTTTLGVSIAASIRVGQHLGSNAPAAARRSCWLAIATGMVGGWGTAVAVLLSRGLWPRLFTGDPAVVALTRPTLLVVASIVIFNGIEGTCGGVLRGVGLQFYGAVINLIGLWVVGIPVSAIAALRCGWGPVGLFGGLLFGEIVMAVGQLLVAWRIRWDEEACKAHTLAAPEESRPLLAT